MSFQIVSERLAALQESNDQLKALIERLATIRFQPGSIPLDTDEDNVMTELISEIHQTLRDQDEDLELLQEDVLDLDTGRPGSELEVQKDRLDHAVKLAIRELKGCQASFRKAQLSARRNLKLAQRAERELLIKSYLEPRSSTASPMPGQQRRRLEKPRELSKEEREVNASSDVTLALRRTHDMMASELSRSQFAHDTLNESTAALAQLSETYSTLDTMLSKSRNLLGTLLTSQKSDTWYLESAFYILLGTIAWLIWRRLLYGPTWWLIYFPLKMFFKGWIGVFTAMGLFGGQKMDVGVSSPVEGRDTVVHSSGTRGPKVTMPGVRNPPSIRVGGGGKGAPVATDGSRGSSGFASESVSEQVGKIIDESGEATIEFEGSDEDLVDEIENQPNPKKRMWEEEKESAEKAQRQKDEL